ncbi:MAG TPA: MFS transporter [Rectinemataceae bacterium]|nr:MFS transporter [Rectinemataceae bacterium]
MRQKNFTLAVISLMMLVLNTEANVMAPKLAAIEREFGVSDASIGLMMGLFTLIGAIVSLLWGFFADKASRKLLFLLSIAIGEIPCALTAFAPNYPVFFALRIVSGIGLGAAFPLVFAIIGDLFEEKERPWASGVISVAIAIGTIAGGVIGGFVGDENSWRLPFILASVPNFFFVAVFWFFTPESRTAASEGATAELVAAGLVYPKRFKVADYAGLFTIRTNLLLLLQGIAGTIPWGSFFFINKYLNEDKGLPVETATLVYIVFGLGMVAGNILGGRFGSILYRRDPKLVPIFCGLTTFLGSLAIIYIVLWAPANPTILSLLGFGAACLASLTGPNMRTMLLDVNAPEQRGAIFSIFNITDSLGTGFGRFVAGSLSGLLGLAMSLALCSTMWLFCAVFLLMASATFAGDIGALRRNMEKVALQMKASAL